jgi:hypothetical protein
MFTKSACLIFKKKFGCRSNLQEKFFHGIPSCLGVWGGCFKVGICLWGVLMWKENSSIT